MTVLAAHQPAYLPYPGYLDRIRRADVFVILGGVQYERGSFANRNKIKTRDGCNWLTVPLKAEWHFETTFSEIWINNQVSWIPRHLSTIYHAYRKAPRFDECCGGLIKMYFKEQYKRILPLCVEQTRFWAKQYEIKTPILVSGPKTEKKSDLVLAICKDFNADVYLSGPLGRDYLDMAAFKKAGIEIKYHEYKMKPYPQLHGRFVPNLSVLDAWMMQKELP